LLDRFLVVLALALFMFGDIIQINTTLSKEDYCNSDAKIPSELCYDALGPIFLKLFALIAGDMSFDEFRHNTAIELILALLVLLGVIVLLNVLIAVISDSYQKPFKNSSQLFGRT
jgi:lipopolysaccharide export LptBFGC system permease protein LptF